MRDTPLSNCERNFLLKAIEEKKVRVWMVYLFLSTKILILLLLCVDLKMYVIKLATLFGQTLSVVSRTSFNMFQYDCE